MRRSPIVIGATIAGTAGVLAFHPSAVVPATAAATTATKTTTSAPAATSSSGSSGSTSGPSSGSSSGSGTATGDAIDTRYGAAQVRVTVSGGKIVKLEALQLQSNDPHSQQISSYAAPLLEQEVLSAQTANVDAVSGATFTSASYTQSVQSALDKLGFKAADGSRATLQVP
jgi:uncharacterized protein with FMN-binding domain